MQKGRQLDIMEKISPEKIEQYKKQMMNLYEKQLPEMKEPIKSETLPITQNGSTEENKTILESKKEEEKEELIHPFKLVHNIKEVNAQLYPNTNEVFSTSNSMVKEYLEQNNSILMPEIKIKENSIINKETKQEKINVEKDNRYSPTKDVTLQEQYEDMVSEFTKKGYLKIQAYTKKRTIPVKGASIEISKTVPLGKYIIRTLKTDTEGMTELVELPAENTKENTILENANEVHAYTTVDITASHENFNPIKYYNVPIYDGIVTVQKVDFISNEN